MQAKYNELHNCWQFGYCKDFRSNSSDHPASSKIGMQKCKKFYCVNLRGISAIFSYPRIGCRFETCQVKVCFANPCISRICNQSIYPFCASLKQEILMILVWNYLGTRWEYARCPKVKVAKINPSKLSAEQTPYMPSIPSVSTCPPHLLPSKEWEVEFLADFSNLRMVCPDSFAAG